ncbi:hypothetical protein [Streptomyces sparsus]
MGDGRSRPVAAGVAVLAATVVLLLAGCSEQAAEQPSRVDVSDGGLCPFLTDGEMEQLNLSVLSPGPGSGDAEADAEKAERKARRDREDRVLDECAYVGPRLGDAPLDQVRARLREGSVTELGDADPRWRAREDAERDGIAFEKDAAFSKDTAVCELLAPGRPADGGDPATTVEVTVFVPVASTAGHRPGDGCAAMNEAAPLIERKFRQP